MSIKTACAVTVEPNMGRLIYHCVSLEYECDFFEEITGESKHKCASMDGFGEDRETKCTSPVAQAAAREFARGVLNEDD